MTPISAANLRPIDSGLSLTPPPPQTTTDMKVLLAAPASAPTTAVVGTLEASGYAVQHVTDVRDVRRALEGPHAPPTVLVDEALPGLDPDPWLDGLRAAFPDRYVYVVFMVDSPDEGAHLVAREAGADDCLVKPVDERELKAYLHTGRRIRELERRLVRARDRFRVQARRDALTGLANRLEIMDCLERELRRAAREEASLAVVMVDLDHFKQINDHYGHPVGDDVLRVAARRMHDAVRGYDVVGRYGGEEFMVVLPRVERDCAGEVAERLRRAIDEMEVGTRAGPLSVTASLGVACIESVRDEEDYLAIADELVGRADAALYEAKRRGRNQVVTSPSDQALAIGVLVVAEAAKQQSASQPLPQDV